MEKRILVVEDEEDLVAVFRMLCDPARYEVMFAGDAGAARLALERHPDLDLVVIDPDLPGGMALCREVKAAHAGVPVLVVTSRIAQLDAARDAGADSAMWKPFEPQELEEMVRRLLEPA